MFTFDKTDVQRIMVSSIGAAALSAACILGVTAPVRAETPAVHSFKGAIEQQLDAAPTALPSTYVAETKVAVQFDGQGRFRRATLLKSSHDVALDNDALRAARALDYPALPAGYQSQTIVLRLLHGASAERVAAERAKDAMTVQYADTGSGAGIKVLAK